MMLSRLPALSLTLAALLALHVPSRAQPSAPDPAPDSMPGPEAEPGTGAMAEPPAELAPFGRGGAGRAPPPASPEEAEERRQERLDTLFARLAEAEGDWERVQGEIWRLWSRSGSPSMDLLLERAEQAAQSGDPELALVFLDDLVRLAPDFAEGWNQRATVYFRLGEYGRAVADIERVLALEPRHFGALSGLALILERLDDEEGAYRAYREALEVHPNLPGAAEAMERLAPGVEGREL